MSSSATDVLVDVTMPQMGVSVAEGTVVEWSKQVGDPVEADEAICSISTDKIDTDVESPARGRVQEILVEVGTTVEVGVALARIAVEDARAPDEQPTGQRSRARRYSPVVTRIAAELGVDLEQVEGTGRGGRVRKADVVAYVESRDAESTGGDAPPLHTESPYRQEEPAAEGRSGSLSRMRRSIGQHMLHSLRTAATCTTVVEADVSRIAALRAQTGFTFLPYIARAAVETLRDYPTLNATLEDDRFTTYDEVHLGIAVSLGSDGLIVPVIRDAQDLSVEGLAARIKDLARRARENRLSPDEVRGGSFTITNPGGYGSVIATPVINQPQVAILDTEAVVRRPVVVVDELGNESLAIRSMTYLCLSWDHRALDGALAARFLRALADRIEAWPP